jgi:hypothetical protein
MAPSKPGRPKGTTKHDEKKTKNLLIRLSPTAYQWVKAQPKGWLPDLLEEMARQ